MNHFSDQSSSALAIETELPLSTPCDSPEKPSWAKRIVLSKLGQLNGGQIELNDAGQLIKLGKPDHDGFSVGLKVAKDAFYRRTLLGGMIGAAESYIDGDWGTDNLTDLIRLMIRNIDGVTKMERTWGKARSWFHRFKHSRNKNTVDGSRKNIQQHYDLGNDFYSLFLDPTMNYSAGIFDSAVADENFADQTSELHGASLVKMDRICKKLAIEPTDHVIEIGTGWGGLAIFMAQNYGCKVTTTTISKEQHAYAVAAVADAGLEDQITVLLKDYRALEGQYDKLVSVEMIEAVGHQFLDTYFAKCNQLLKPTGTMLIQAILIGQQSYQSYRKGVDFIRAYVFPGGCLPSAVTISQSVGRATSMRMLDYEDMSQHYADTLRHWRHSFIERLNDVKAQGFDEYFIRLWHFYLCYCEAAFAERRCQSVQIMFAKNLSPIDPATKIF
jgi:cyclopropane-fatty-acyl-phospholipid synthase